MQIHHSKDHAGPEHCHFPSRFNGDEEVRNALSQDREKFSTSEHVPAWEIQVSKSVRCFIQSQTSTGLDLGFACAKLIL